MNSVRRTMWKGSDRGAGLCNDCQHARLIQTPRGSRFLLCQLASSRADFAKYPRLPVVSCCGYEPLTPKPAAVRVS